MKIAIITTEFLEDFVKDAVTYLNSTCEIEIHTYRDFSDVGQVYLDLEDRFDGFMVSGPIPKAAIIKRADKIKKPLVDFGTDLQSYYEMFFKLMYKYNTLDFSRAYLDFTDSIDGGKDITYYLSTCTLGNFMQEIHKRTLEKSLDEIEQMERAIAQKHILLWNEGKIDFSTTRFSSIVPQLKEAGVNYHFIYPSVNLLKDTLNKLIKDIDIQNLEINQSAVIYITVKQENVDEDVLNKIHRLLNTFKKAKLTDFIIEKNDSIFKIFTKRNTLESITENFTVCPLKGFIEEELLINVCVGYGIGIHVNEAVFNAVSANKESNSNMHNYSFIVTENDYTIGPLQHNKGLTVYNDVTPYIKEISKKVRLSTLTIQKLLGVVSILKTNELSSQELASCLNVSVRTANRFLSSLLKHGEAQILYERQNSTKGRPERVYKLLIEPEK
ncbi:MAG: hypothetical protein RR891_01705 [Clostridium sp.]